MATFVSQDSKGCVLDAVKQHTTVVYTRTSTTVSAHGGEKTYHKGGGEKPHGAVSSDGRTCSREGGEINLDTASRHGNVVLPATETDSADMSERAIQEHCKIDKPGLLAFSGTVSSERDP